MTWLGPELDPDQRGLADMLDAFVADKDLDLTDDAEQLAALRRELAELGVWTLGVSEDHGGGGADRAMTTVAYERLGCRWPALALAAVHAHAAADVLGPAGEDELLAAIHDGGAVVAVVDSASDYVRITRDGETVSGEIDRVNVSGEPTAVVVLTGEGALLLAATALTAGVPLRRTGLGGAWTTALTVQGLVGESVRVLDAVDLTAVRNRLRLGAAAVAAGIAGGAAAQAATYAAGRQQFGGPLTAIPTVRASLLTQTSRSSAALGAVLAAGTHDTVAATAALTLACDTAVEVAAAALQSHGGYGYLTEYLAERSVRDAVSLRAAVDAAGIVEPEARALVGMAPATEGVLT